MRAVVLIPYRPDGAERERNWGLAARQYADLGLPVYASNPPGDVFSPGEAVNQAARHAGDWDVAFVNDADLVLDRPSQITAAIRSAHSVRHRMVRAQDVLYYLSSTGVRQYADGRDIRRCQQSDPPIRRTGEKPYAISRSLWDQLGGYDPRFVGYGAEGIAFAAAAGTFGDCSRVLGGCYHLDHPLVDRSQVPTFGANCELAERYRRAYGKPHIMRQLLAEARA